MYFRFMDDVTFGHSGPYGNAWLAALLYPAGSDVYECLVVSAVTVGIILASATD